MRYIPFWAVPLLMICGQFAYIYWLKSIKTTAYLFVVLGGVSIFFIGFYIYVGGGENVAVFIQKRVY
jgi:hypothetical protein